MSFSCEEWSYIVVCTNDYKINIKCTKTQFNNMVKDIAEEVIEDMIGSFNQTILYHVDIVKDKIDTLNTYYKMWWWRVYWINRKENKLEKITTYLNMQQHYIDNYEPVTEEEFNNFSIEVGKRKVLKSMIDTYTERNKSTSNIKQELLIFVKQYILSNPQRIKELVVSADWVWHTARWIVELLIIKKDIKTWLRTRMKSWFKKLYLYSKSS